MTNKQSEQRISDLQRLLLALGLGDHARPISPAETFDLCLQEALRLRQNNSQLLTQLQHAVHWHDQLTARDIARYEAVIAEANPSPSDGEVSEAMVEAAEEVFYGRHERGFIMRPLIDDESGRRDMRKALTAAFQSSKRGQP